MGSPDPVGGAGVTLLAGPETYFGCTSSQGFFCIPGIPTGNYCVQISGRGVFNENGARVPDRISLVLMNVTIRANETTTLLGRPVFLPTRDLGTDFATGGTPATTVPANTLVGSTSGASLVFEQDTLTTFPDPALTNLALTQVPIDELPVPLPTGLAAGEAFAIQELGVTFASPVKLILPNSTGAAGGTTGIGLFQFDEQSLTWQQFGTGTVTADGSQVVSDSGSGLLRSGFVAATVPSFCITTVEGTVVDSGGMGVPDINVVTAAGASAFTDVNGDYSIPNVPVPSMTFNLIVIATPLAPNSGFHPAATPPPGISAVCGGITPIPDLVLPDEPVDLVAPIVTSVDPADGAIDVPDNAALVITFDDEMTPSTLNSSTILLECGLPPVPVSGAIGVNLTLGGPTIATFVPDALLPLGSDCTIKVTTGVIDKAGNPLAAEFTSSFTTVPVPTMGPPPASITISPVGPLTVDPTITLQLTPDVRNAASVPISGAQVEWNSSDPNVASVDATGLVTARIPGGPVVITGTFGSISDTVGVNVPAPPILSVIINPFIVTLATNGIESLMALATDGLNGTGNLLPANFSWSSSDTNAVTVDASGVIFGVAAGSATITATETGGISGQAIVSVMDPMVTVQSVTVAPTTATIAAGATQQFTAIAFDGLGGTGNVVPGVTFDWSSDVPSVATVDPLLGLATGIASGAATISATGGGQVGSAALTVSASSSFLVSFLGGTMGTSPVPGVRVLRHDPTTGALLDDLVSDVNGIVDFGVIGTPRTTITIVEPELFPGGESYLLTFANVAIGNLPFQGFGADPPLQAFFDVMLTGLPGVTEAGLVFTGGTDEGDSFLGFAAPPTALVGGVEVLQLQPNGLFSMLAVAGLFDGTVTACGAVVDLDPASITPGSSVAIPTSGIPSSIPYTANGPILIDNSSIRRSGLFFDIRLPGSGATPASTGNAVFCDLPGADRYSFTGSSSETPTQALREVDLHFDTPPASLSVVLPALNITGVARDSATETISWSPSGASLAGVDASIACWEWDTTANGFFEWEVVSDGSATIAELPQLPANLAIFNPPVEGVEISVELFSLDNANGFDGILSQLGAHNGSFESLFIASNSLAVAEKSVRVLRFDIGGSGTGTVTANGVAVSDGDFFEVAGGTPVTIVATPAGGFSISNFFCTNGAPSGDPAVQQTCIANNLFAGAFAQISFD